MAADDDGARARRLAIEREIRERLELPGWSNLRGDDVISRVEALDPASRVRLNYLFAELQELKDADRD